MRAIAQTMLQGVQDQVALDVGHGIADQGAHLVAGRGLGLSGGRGGVRPRRLLDAGRAQGSPCQEQRVLGDHAVLGEQHGAVHGVFQLAHVAAPEVVLQQFADLRAERRRRHAVGLRVFGDEMLGERLDVLGTVAQGGQGDGHHVQPEIEVFAEIAPAHLFLEVAVRGGEQPDVHLDRLRAADAIDFPLLDGAQQLRLQPRVHLRDLVEQQSAAARLLELADASTDGAGEGAPLVAEELRFEERVGNRRAVQRDELLAGAVGLGMEVAGDDFLAGARLAGDHHAGVRRRDLIGQTQNLRHCRVPVHEGVGLLRHCFQNRRDQIGVGRQRDVFLGAGADRVDRQFRIGTDAAAHDGHGDALGLEAGAQPGHVEADVDHDQIGALAGSKRGQRRVDGIDVGDLGAVLEGDLAGGCDMTV